MTWPPYLAVIACADCLVAAALCAWLVKTTTYSPGIASGLSVPRMDPVGLADGLPEAAGAAEAVAGAAWKARAIEAATAAVAARDARWRHMVCFMESSFMVGVETP